MTCDLCRGTGLVVAHDDYGPLSRYVKCTRCHGTGTLRSDGTPATSPTSARGSARAFSAGDVAKLLLELPHDSDTSWRAWCLIQVYRDECFAALARMGPCVALTKEHERLRAKLGEDLRALTSPRVGGD